MCAQKQAGNSKEETYFEDTSLHQSTPVRFGTYTSLVFVYSVSHGGKLWQNRMLKLKAKFKVESHWQF